MAIVQGGLLRWRRPRHTHVLIEVLLVVLEFLYMDVCQVEDSLQRVDELGLRVWRHQAAVFSSSTQSCQM